MDIREVVQQVEGPHGKRPQDEVIPAVFKEQLEVGACVKRGQGLGRQNWQRWGGHHTCRWLSGHAMTAFTLNEMETQTCHSLTRGPLCCCCAE